MAVQFFKDPAAVLDYEFDWAAWLGSDTITAHTVTADSGITVESSTATTTAVTAWLSGGTAGNVYSVTNHIETAAGREDHRTLMVRVLER